MNLYEWNFDVPEVIPWDILALLFGEDFVNEWRSELDDIERFENEGGPCV